MSGSNANLTSTELGGENTQYESIKTVTVPPSKSSGQLGAGQQHSGSSTDTTSKERGERTAENIRYGQAISEQGVGGMTTTSTGEAQQDGYGSVAAGSSNEDSIEASGTRTQQGYGSGSGIGG